MIRAIRSLVSRHPFLIIGSALFILAFTGGFYTYAAIQKNLQLLILAAIIFAVLTWAGSGADFLGLLSQWYKDIQQDKRTPGSGTITKTFSWPLNSLDGSNC